MILRLLWCASVMGIVKVLSFVAVKKCAILRPTTHVQLSPKSILATTLVTAIGLMPFGNLAEALKAISSDVESLTCTLDTEQADEYHDSCQQKKNIVRFRAGKFLTLRQDWGGSSSTGAAVWNGANMAGWYMENILGSKLKGSTVLELGAGVGFDSIIAYELGAKQVLITDGNLDVLKLADENIAINCDDSSNIKTAQLRWNTNDEDEPMKDQWDYIFAADVTYLKKNRHDLISSIVHLSNPKTVAFVSMEPRNVDEVEDVLREAEAQGLQWTEEQLPVDPETAACNLLCPRLFSLRKT